MLVWLVFTLFWLRFWFGSLVPGLVLGSVGSLVGWFGSCRWFSSIVVVFALFLFLVGLLVACLLRCVRSLPVWVCVFVSLVSLVLWLDLFPGGLDIGSCSLVCSCWVCSFLVSSVVVHYRLVVLVWF